MLCARERFWSPSGRATEMHAARVSALVSEQRSVRALSHVRAKAPLRSTPAGLVRYAGLAEKQLTYRQNISTAMPLSNSARSVGTYLLEWYIYLTLAKRLASLSLSDSPTATSDRSRLFQPMRRQGVCWR
jgi:hypothetical protein